MKVMSGWPKNLPYSSSWLKTHFLVLLTHSTGLEISIHTHKYPFTRLLISFCICVSSTQLDSRRGKRLRRKRKREREECLKREREREIEGQKEKAHSRPGISQLTARSREASENLFVLGFVATSSYTRKTQPILGFIALSGSLCSLLGHTGLHLTPLSPESEKSLSLSLFKDEGNNFRLQCRWPRGTDGPPCATEPLLFTLHIFAAIVSIGKHKCNKGHPNIMATSLQHQHLALSLFSPFNKPPIY